MFFFSFSSRAVLKRFLAIDEDDDGFGFFTIFVFVDSSSSIGSSVLMVIVLLFRFCFYVFFEFYYFLGSSRHSHIAVELLFQASNTKSFRLVCDGRQKLKLLERKGLVHILWFFFFFEYWCRMCDASCRCVGLFFYFSRSK